MLSLLLWEVRSMMALLAYLMLANAVAFGVFMYDKRQARRGGYRISERSLLLLSLLGGSIGAFAAMQVARHKTSKLSFRLPFQTIIALQAIGLAAYAFWPEQASAAISQLLA
jgi:uncharacterized membrane protein YsdA (DUF1294 family)